MLEQAQILLRRCAASPRAAEPLLEVLDPGSSERLGVVRRAAPAAGWRRWLTRPALTVHEAEDEPLVFTLARRWSLTPAWSVRDADGHLVGTLRRFDYWLFGGQQHRGAVNRRGRLILDRIGRHVAVWRAAKEPAAGSLLGPNGEELATLASTADGAVLHFTAQVHGEPFLKMLFLAAALLFLLGETP